jgi:small-conductance mechanosensitive channel
MSEITDWEPIETVATDYKALFEEQQKINDALVIENRDLSTSEQENSHLICKLRRELHQNKTSSANTFICFKADVLVLLKALELVAIASQRHGEIALNHHVRDMRLEHLQGIITNAIKDFSDRTLSSYDDDF